MTSEKLNMLHPVDYVIFAAGLLVALGIGIYHAVTGDRQSTTGDYYHGRRQMGLLPVTLSLMMTFVSTMALLGYPAEIYAFGAQGWLGCWGIIIGVMLASVIFVPVLHPLQVTSVNEYLELRYGSKLIKYIGCACSVGGNALFTGFVLFGPSTAIEGVSGFPSWASIFISSAVSICYTCIGGFRAVVWTDVFQSCVLMSGLLAVSVQGLLSVGGFGRMWQLADDWGRLNFLDFDPDPTKRMNFYGVVFGNALTFMGLYGYQQVGVQRYSALRSQTKARLGLCSALCLGFLVISTLCCLCGLIVFAHYAMVGCDPKVDRRIHNYNQVLPYFVAEALQIPVVPGLFMSSLFAASLSSASSAMNSAAANIWADILRDRQLKLSERQSTLLNKAIVLVFGLISFIMAMCFDQLRGTMLQAMTTVSSALGGPYSALFFMGLFIPWVNWKGVSVGCLAGFVFALWVCLGSFTVPKNWQELPAPSNCSIHPLASGFNESNTILSYAVDTVNTTLSTLEVAMPLNSTGSSIATHGLVLSGVQKLYSLSFLWMREAIGAVTIVTSIIASLLTGYRRPSTVPHNLVHPWLRRLLTLDPTAALSRSQQAAKVPFGDVAYSKGNAGEAVPPSIKENDTSKI